MPSLLLITLVVVLAVFVKTLYTGNFFTTLHVRQEGWCDWLPTAESYPGGQFWREVGRRVKGGGGTWRAVVEDRPSSEREVEGRRGGCPSWLPEPELVVPLWLSLDCPASSRLEPFLFFLNFLLIPSLLPLPLTTSILRAPSISSSPPIFPSFFLFIGPPFPLLPQSRTSSPSATAPTSSPPPTTGTCGWPESARSSSARRRRSSPRSEAGRTRESCCWGRRRIGRTSRR